MTQTSFSLQRLDVFVARGTGGGSKDGYEGSRWYVLYRIGIGIGIARGHFENLSHKHDSPSTCSLVKRFMSERGSVVVLQSHEAARHTRSHNSAKNDKAKAIVIVVRVLVSDG